jgi:hypothetical protein
MSVPARPHRGTSAARVARRAATPGPGARAKFEKMDGDANGFPVEAELAAGHEKLMPKPRK